jgi:uncharacterized membrane protein
MGNLPAIYLATLVTLLAVDLVCMILVMKPLFERHVGALLARPLRFGSALAFYLVYAAGVVVLAIDPAMRAGSLGTAATLGAVLGFCAYATYELTNRATLQAWPMSIVVIDIAWGTVLTALAAVAGYLTDPAL